MSHFKDQLIAIFDYSIIFNAFNDTFPDLLRHLCIYFEFWQHQSFTCRKLNLVGLHKSFKTPKKLNVFRVNLSTACNSLSHISSIYHLVKDDIKTSSGEGGEATEEGEMRESREPAIIFIIIIIIIWCYFSCDHSWMSLFSFVSPSCFSILLPFFLSLLHSLNSFFTGASFRPLSPLFHFRCPPAPASYVIRRQQCLSLSWSFSQQIHPTHHHSHIISLHPTVTGWLTIYPHRFTVILRFSDLGRWSRHCLIDDGDKWEARSYSCLSWRLWKRQDVKNVINHRKWI